MIKLLTELNIPKYLRLTISTKDEVKIEIQTKTPIPVKLRIGA